MKHVLYKHFNLINLNLKRTTNMKRFKVEILIHYLFFDITEPLQQTALIPKCFAFYEGAIFCISAQVIYIFCHESQFDKNSNFRLIYTYLKV